MKGIIMRRAVAFLLIECLLLIPFVGNVHADDEDDPLPPRPIRQPTVVAPPAQESYSSEYEKGYAHGQSGALRYHNSDGWGYGGFAGGIFLGLIGTGIVAASSGGGVTDPPLNINVQLSKNPLEYQMGYKDGYRRSAKSANLNSAIIGGLGGTAVLVAIIVFASALN